MTSRALNVLKLAPVGLFGNLSLTFVLAMSLGLSGCSKDESSPVQRPPATGSNIGDPYESIAGFSGEDEAQGSQFQGEDFTALTPIKSEYMADEEPSDVAISGGGISVVVVEGGQEASEIVVTEDLVENLNEDELVRDYVDPESLQSTMRDVRHPRDIYAQDTFHQHPSFSTGARMNEDYFYTDGDQDGLMGELRQTLSSPRDQQFSSQIHGVQVEGLNTKTGDHTLIFRIAGSNFDHVYSARGDSSGFLHYSGVDQESLRVEGLCLDFYDRCHNMVIRVQKVEDGEILTGFIVHRDTPGSVFLEGRQPLASNSPVDRWNKFIENTKAHRQLRDAGARTSSILNRMQYYVLTTTSTVYGESRFYSEMEVLRENMCGEKILINGPLAKFVGNIEFFLPLSQPRTEFISRNGYTQEDLGLYMGELQRAALINNNGLGEIRVELQVANSVAQESLRLTFQRKGVETNLDRLCYFHDVKGRCSLEERMAFPLER